MNSKQRKPGILGWFDEMRFSWLDVKLGSRMLLKYPVLTIVGGRIVHEAQ